MPRHPLDHDPELMEALDAPMREWVRDEPDAFDVPEPEPEPYDPSRPPGGPPDIAPPLMLDPIPAPTLTAPPPTVAEAQVEADAEDPYAWAAAAASSMEREGRHFDTSEVELPPGPDTAVWDGQGPDPWAHLDENADARAPLVEAPHPEDRHVDIETVEPPRAPAPAGDPMKLALAGAILMGMAALMLIVIVMRPRTGSDDAILRPVPSSIDASAPARRYAAPPEAATSLPGATVTFGEGRPGDDPSNRPAPAPMSSTITVASDPSGAVIRVDGRVYGHTPEKLDLPFGTYVVELLLDGHTGVRERLVVDADTSSYSATLVPERAQGRAEVFATGWEGATLLVDGVDMGVLPCTIQLTPGDHEFVLERDGDRVVEHRKVWVAGTRPVKVDLTP